MLNDLLNALDFKDEEVQTYLTLLDNGPSTAGALAKAMGMKRPSVYVYLERLVSGGLATQSSRRGVKLFIAEPGEKIRLLYKRRIEALKMREKSLDQILPQLEKRAALSFVRPQTQIFEGAGGVQNAMEDLLNYQDIKAYVIWPIASMIDVLTPDFLRYHNMVRIQRRITYNSIWERNQGEHYDVPNYLGTGPRYYREIRLAPNKFEFQMGVQFYANKVVFLSSRAESFAVMIESKEIFEVQLAQFLTIWDLAQPFPIDPQNAHLFFEEFD